MVNSKAIKKTDELICGRSDFFAQCHREAAAQDQAEREKLKAGGVKPDPAAKPAAVAGASKSKASGSKKQKLG